MIPQPASTKLPQKLEGGYEFRKITSRRRMSLNEFPQAGNVWENSKQKIRTRGVACRNSYKLITPSERHFSKLIISARLRKLIQTHSIVHMHFERGA